MACFVPPCEYTQPNCKVDFAKIKKNAFFLMPIRYISQKCIIFAAKFKNGYKITKNNLY